MFKITARSAMDYIHIGPFKTKHEATNEAMRMVSHLQFTEGTVGERHKAWKKYCSSLVVKI